MGGGPLNRYGSEVQASGITLEPLTKHLTWRGFPLLKPKSQYGKITKATKTEDILQKATKGGGLDLALWSMTASMSPRFTSTGPIGLKPTSSSAWSGAPLPSTTWARHSSSGESRPLREAAKTSYANHPATCIF